MYLITFIKADKVVREKFEVHKAYMDMLSGGPNNLESATKIFTKQVRIALGIGLSNNNLSILKALRPKSTRCQSWRWKKNLTEWD